MKRLVAFGSVFVAGLAVGLLYNAVNLKTTSEGDGLGALQDGEVYTAQVFKLGNETVTDDWCAGNQNALPEGYRVADFMHDYITFFAAQEGERYSRFIPCGERRDNTCGISYGEHNAEGNKGYSRTLWFDISTETDLILPESFVCSGQ